MKGIAFHCHHNTLVEYVHDYDERVEYIKNYKPEHEQELRLKLFKMIPVDRLPQKGLDAYVKTMDAFYKANDAFDKASDAFYKARDAFYKASDASYKDRDAFYKASDAYDKALDVYDKALDAYYKARTAYDKARDAYFKANYAFVKARDAYFKDNEDEFDKLHKELCPDCTWNGETIF